MAFKKGDKKPANSGRSKGAINKVNADVKSMILSALDKAGGAAYLLQQAQNNPNAFMALVGKVLPTQVNTEISGALKQAITVKFEAVKK